MPAKAAEEIDRAAVAKAGAWALQYLLDPQRGAGKRFPTKEEIQTQFPGVKLASVEQVENWIYQKLGSTNIEAITKEPQKIEGLLKETKKEEAHEAKKGTVLPPASLLRTATTSPTGVLEEIDAALDKHKKQTARTLTADLTPQVKSFITSIAPKGLTEQQLNQLSAQIAQEVSRETLENVPKVVDMSQAPDVITDSLVSTVLVEPALIPNPEKQNIQKLLEKAAPIASRVVAAHQQDLEKVVVLENISRISQFEKLDPQTQEVIDLKVDQILESQHPLATRAETAALSGNLKSYVQNYAKDFKETLVKETGGQIPSFAQFQKVQGKVHQKSSQPFKEQVTKNLGSQAKTLTSRVNIAQLPDELADALRLRPFTRDQLERLGLGSAEPKLNTFTKAAPGLANWGTGIALATNANFQTQAFWVALASSGNLPKNAQKLAAEAKSLEAEIKLKGSLSYPKAKRRNLITNKLGVITAALKFKTKNPRPHQTFVSWYNSLPSRQRLGWASATSQAVTDAYFGDQYLFVPRLALARHPNQFLANRTFGAMAHGLGNFSLGNLLHISSGSMRPAFGMGKGLLTKTTPEAIIASKVAGVMGRIAKVTGGVFLGFGIYFAMLGQAALTGFLIGATIGGTIGATVGGVIGFQIGVALAPFTFGLSIPFFTLAGIAIGGFVGGTIGGIAGGLIAYGMAAGSTTAVTTGVGAGVGGTVGTYVGATVGATAGTAVGTALAAAFPPLAPLIPVFTLTGMAIGGVIGGYLGTLIGAGIGYAIGHYVIPVFNGTAIGINNFFAGTLEGTTGGIGGLLATTGSFFTGLASSIWGGLVTAGGATIGGLISAGGGLIGALSSISIPSGLAAISVGSGALGIVAVGTIIGITTAATFFNPDADQGQIVGGTGDNEFFTITKTASNNQFDNPPPNHDVTFTITLTAKDKDLSGVLVTDELRVQGSSPHTITRDNQNRPVSPIPCLETIPAHQSCSYSFNITVDSSFHDLIIINTANAQATPAGESQINDSKTVTVRVGNPPANCPTGWPVDGQISQGPMGASSHAPGAFAPDDPGYEALDIAQENGHPVYSTVDGIVVEDWQRGDSDQRIGIEPSGCSVTIVKFWHMQSRLVHDGDTVTAGQQIGESGSFIDADGNAAPHIHYQFNQSGVRTPQIGPPYVPLPSTFNRPCDSIAECNVTISPSDVVHP